MIRVFLISLLALGALVIVARNLPEGSGAADDPSLTLDDQQMFAQWDGAWEGTFRTYATDGTLQETIQVRQVYESVSPMEQTVVITDRMPDGTTRVSRGRNVLFGGRLECEVRAPDGTTKVLAGRRAGNAVIWHRREPASGAEETYREEILRTLDGDLYTIDGLRTTGGRGGTVLYEGRYRRVERDEG